jgi:cob(I)alamin adenosyltransferase
MRDFPRRPEDALADEVRALRHDIAQLRAELKPVQSLILTGQQVAAEFRRLSGGRTC